MRIILFSIACLLPPILPLLNPYISILSLVMSRYLFLHIPPSLQIQHGGTAADALLLLLLLLLLCVASGALIAGV